MNARTGLSPWIVAFSVLAAGCSRPPTGSDSIPSKSESTTAAPGATPKESADAFVARLNREMGDLAKEANTADFAYETYINPDTEFLNAKAQERYLAYFSTAVEESKRYDGEKLSADTRRALDLLKLGVAAPAPKDPAKRAELSQITTRMQGRYGSAKYCPNGPDSCQDLTKLTAIMAHDRNYDHLLDAWTGWHSTAQSARPDYTRFVELANEGARELGFADLGMMWRSGYDMPPAAFTQDTERLWGQVKPLYEQLHCYVRRGLQKTYGKEHVPDGKPIPAHLLGNLWAQQWSDIYPLVEPYPGVAGLDVTPALQAQKYDAKRVVESAEHFYESLGFPQLPASFWERSMLVKPRDRDVECHASALHIDGKDDVRVKECILPDETSLETTYHELGHVYYFLSYRPQPYLFQGGANDGFHEAIGDTINLSLTPQYLHTIGLLGNVKVSRQATINRQMQVALDKIAFLPFGKLIDEWRWKVFSGEIKPENYNAGWWKLREEYQGVASPVPRTEADFDPGAKYHIPANTPYARYFLSFILQFQFHRALCEASGFKGPLNECSIYGNEAAGRRFQKMLELGQSKPWQDALQELTGSREVDASAITEYFAPLMGWLKEQNAGQMCGWQ